MDRVAMTDSPSDPMTPDRATLDAALPDSLFQEMDRAFMRVWREREEEYHPQTADDILQACRSAQRRVLVDRLVEALRPTGETSES